jgi:hypothetical protein
MLWVFSEILESVCVLPQLLLLRQTTVPTVIDSFYLLTLGSYRGFYCMNWIWREVDNGERVKPDAISVIFGVIQTILYIDFAWVYWTRQRVKLRHGGIVDSDDLSRGWLIGRILGHKDTEVDEESEPAANGANGSTGRPRAGGRWGARGISVSADEGVLDAPQQKAQPPNLKARDEEIVGILNDDDDDSDDGVLPTLNDALTGSAGVSGGEEWRSGRS